MTARAGNILQTSSLNFFFSERETNSCGKRYWARSCGSFKAMGIRLSPTDGQVQLTALGLSHLAPPPSYMLHQATCRRRPLDLAGQWQRHSGCVFFLSELGAAHWGGELLGGMGVLAAGPGDGKLWPIFHFVLGRVRQTSGYPPGGDWGPGCGPNPTSHTRCGINLRRGESHWYLGTCWNLPA